MGSGFSTSVPYEGEHFNDGDEVEEEGEAAEVDGCGFPAVPVQKDSGKDGDTRACVENRRHSEPKQNHSVVYVTT